MENKKYKLLIFDLDGTVLNSLEDLKSSLNAALEQNGYPVRTLDEVRRFVGNGMRKLIERGVPAGTSEEMIVKVHQDFRAHYSVHSNDTTRPYKGILPMLRVLRQRGYTLALVSNKSDESLQVLVGIHFDNIFHFAIGEKEGFRKKPYPDSVEYVMKKYGIDKKDTVYIGDSEVDYQTSVNSGVDHIICRWGFREEELLRSYGAEVFVSEPYEILEKV